MSIWWWGQYTWESEHELGDVEEAADAVARRVDQHDQDQDAGNWFDHDDDAIYGDDDDDADDEDYDDDDDDDADEDDDGSDVNEEDKPCNKEVPPLPLGRVRQ